MTDASVELYCEMFERMNRATSGRYKAPHKPILLIAIISLIAKGAIRENKIVLDRQLEDAFKWHWNTLVDDGHRQDKVNLSGGLDLEISGSYPFKCNIANPFYHLTNEPFWHLVPSAEWVERRDYGVSQLRKCFSYAELDNQLFNLLLDEEPREALKACLYGMI